MATEIHLDLCGSQHGGKHGECMEVRQGLKLFK